MAQYEPRLKTRYKSEIIDRLSKKFSYGNRMQVPRLVKITVNKGVGEATQNKKLLDGAVDELRRITGQQPAVGVHARVYRTLNCARACGLGPVLRFVEIVCGSFLIG